MFDTILMQIAGNEIDSTLTHSLSTLVTSFAILVGVIVPLIVSGLAYVKTKSQDPKINEAIDTAIHVGLIATAVANKSLENKQNIKALIDIDLRTDSSDIEKTRAEKQALFEKLDYEIKATEAQIKRLIPMIPGNANADTIPTLPRESDFSDYDREEKYERKL
jgi:hypothetical protein